jgi:hypothetical protein
MIAVQTVVRLRGAPSTDAYNDAETDWSDPASLPISGCSVQPVQGDENLLGRESVISRWTLFAPPDADIRSSDRVRHNGVDFDIDGSVQDWPDLFGLGYKQCLLRKVEG